MKQNNYQSGVKYLCTQRISSVVLKNQSLIRETSMFINHYHKFKIKKKINNAKNVSNFEFEGKK